jgi:hypothetical protein
MYRFWRYAAADARTWGQQTGRKYRVSRFRDAYVVRPTNKRATVRRIEITISPLLDGLECSAPTGFINASGIQIADQ